MEATAGNAGNACKLNENTSDLVDFTACTSEIARTKAPPSPSCLHSTGSGTDQRELQLRTANAAVL